MYSEHSTPCISCNKHFWSVQADNDGLASDTFLGGLNRAGNGPKLTGNGLKKDCNNGEMGKKSLEIDWKWT